MANYRALSVACEGICKVLESSYDQALLGTALNFAVWRTPDFQTPFDPGVSLYLYRVVPNAVHRTPPSRIVEKGRVRRPQLPLDLHFLVTAWAKKSTLEHEILGWAMRALDDHAVIPASALNAVSPKVFLDDEIVEVVPGQLSVEEMMRIWDKLPSNYQPSVPYVARVIRIETLLPSTPYATVSDRELETYPK